MDFRANSSSISIQSLVFSRVFFAVPKPCILSRFLHPARNHGNTHAFQSDSEWKSKNVWRFTVFSPRSETINIYDGSEAYTNHKNTCNLFKSTLYLTELMCFLVFSRQCSNTIIYDGSEPYIRISKGVFFCRYARSPPLRRVTRFMNLMLKLTESIVFSCVLLAVQERRYLRHFGRIAKMSKKHVQIYPILFANGLVTGWLYWTGWAGWLDWQG